ncbi:MAG: S-layer homology domain-containing protein [Armatimonadetes bacterium]|nr:S-layer homology domain-containing protein [Armatimonadota bacterium]
MVRMMIGLAVGCAVLVPGPVFAQQNRFSDVPKTHWAYAAVQELAQKKIVKAEPGGKFMGNKPVTRFELAVTLAKFLKYLDIRELKGKAAAQSAPLSLKFQPLTATVISLEGVSDVVVDKGWRDGMKPEMALTIRRGGKDAGTILATDVQERRTICSAGNARLGVKPGDKVYTRPATIRPTLTGGKPLPKSDPAYESLVWLVSWGYVPANSKLLMDGNKPVTADEAASALGRAFSRSIEKGDIVGDPEAAQDRPHTH